MYSKVKLVVPYGKVDDLHFMVGQLRRIGYDVASVLNAVRVGEPTFVNGIVVEVSCIIRNPICAS